MTYIGTLTRPSSQTERRRRFKRFEALKQMPCVVCRKDGRITFPIEIHHLNKGGQAGRERRGDMFTIPLCRWHHQGIPLQGQTTKQMRPVFGPSLKLQSKAFRATYGKDDELLAEVNRLLGEGTLHE